MQADKETLQVLSDGEKLTQLTKSDGWAIARAKFVDKVLDLQSIMNLPQDNLEAALIDIKARKLAIEILQEFFSEIEGASEQHKEVEEATRGYFRRD